MGRKRVCPIAAASTKDRKPSATQPTPDPGLLGELRGDHRRGASSHGRWELTWAMGANMGVLLVLRRKLANQRGIGLIATGIWIMAFFALTAVGVDVARIAFTATEVQTIAEVAATGAATTIVNGG